MLTLSNIAKMEGAAMSSDGAWLVLLEITLQQAGTLRLVRNNEDITWAGQTWIAFPFELDPVKETSDGELPTVSIRVSNVMRALNYYLEQGTGGVDAPVTIRVVHSKNLSSPVPEIEETFTVQSTSYDAQWVTFTLGGRNNLQRRFPQDRILRDFCRFKFKGPQCKYAGSAATCGHTFAECRARGNQARFGGEPSIPTSGLYDS